MEADVLVAGEQVQQGARDAGQALEVAQSGRVHVDPAEADPFGLDVADPRARPVETGGTAAQAAAEVEVVESALDHAAGSLWMMSASASSRANRSGMAISSSADLQ